MNARGHFHRADRTQVMSLDPTREGPQALDQPLEGRPEGLGIAPLEEVLPTSLFERPAEELYVDDSAQLGDDRRQPDHIA